MKYVVGFSLLSLTFLTSCFFSSNADFGRLFLQIAAIVNISPTELFIGTDSYGIRSHQFTATGGTAPYTFYYSSSIGSYADTSGLFFPGSSPETIYLTARDFAGQTSTATVQVLDAQKIIPQGVNEWLDDDHLGAAVAISRDWLVIGAPENDYDESGGNYILDAGAVYVYRRNGASWDYFTKLVSPSRVADEEFGTSVAIDGNIMVVGAPYYGANDNGRAVIYEYNGSSWGVSYDIRSGAGQISTPLTNTDANFGIAVAVNQNRVAITAHYSTAVETGYAFVFEKSDAGVWAQMGATGIIGSDSANGDNFGNSVDIKGDYMVVGAPSKTESAFASAGAAYVYHLVGGLWVQVAKLVHSTPEIGLNFGGAVGISNNMIAVGALGHNGLSSDDGEVVVFDMGANDSIWNEKTSTVIPYDNYGNDDRDFGEYFGVTLRFNGGHLVVGSPYEDLDEGGLNAVATAGAAYVYECYHGESACRFRNKIVATGTNARGNGDFFGASVGITRDGWVISGSQFHERDIDGSVPGVTSDFNSGAVWVSY